MTSNQIKVERKNVTTTWLQGHGDGVMLTITTYIQYAHRQFNFFFGVILQMCRSQRSAFVQNTITIEMCVFSEQQ